MIFSAASQPTEGRMGSLGWPTVIQVGLVVGRQATAEWGSRVNAAQMSGMVDVNTQKVIERTLRLGGKFESHTDAWRARSAAAAAPPLADESMRARAALTVECVQATHLFASNNVYEFVERDRSV